ncbi:MAG: UDP-N-acetylmuramoyl-L-alanyl-D-glutamate--2,6-diaminopimelate ligase [Actinobacteria bacterium]|nr:UDP-N-acetylmuramoyl-L-alanyl-D-glutamate--2,6-diaminopimelate ligase [Actinomycetota bacterium]
MQLDAISRAVGAVEVIGAAPVEIADLAHDTRAVTPGALFFCTPGANLDGHALAQDAVAAGAVALVVERPLDAQVPQVVVESVRAAMAVAADAFFGEPTRRLTVAGVTGTSGKTTTAFLLRSILEAAGRSTGLVGTVDWIAGGERRKGPHTTPEAIELHRLFREMIDLGDEAVAIEASSHGAHYRRLDRVRFDALVFTNLSQDHLDLHGDMESYFLAKRTLFTGIEPPPAAVNVGDPHGRRLADELAAAHRAPLVTFGLRPDAEVRADRLKLDRNGARFEAAGIEIATRLRGIFNVENVLGAVAAGTLLDLDDEAIARGIASVDGIPGRFEAIDEGQPFAVIVDYAHKPGALDTVLQSARDLGPGRLAVVFGAGGDRDREKRPLMGKVARERADVVVVTSDNPRSEEPLAIIEQIVQGTGVDVEIDPDRRSAIHTAIAGAGEGDVVVIAGKGHEQGQEANGSVTPFDDREVAREALRAAGYGA